MEPCSSNYLPIPVSPPQKRKRPPFSSSEKKIIVNLYKNLEKTQPGDQHDKTSVHEKTAEIVGVSTPAVYKVLKEHAMNALPALITMKKKPPYTGKLSDRQINEIRKKVYTFYMNREAPSVKTIFTAVNQDENLPLFKRNTFENVLKRLKFKPLRRVGTDSVLDYGRVVIRRREYLNKIKKCRDENRPIYYLDELWVNEEDAPASTNDAANPKAAKETRLILLHIGNENGFVAGADRALEWQAKPKRGLVKAEHFESWFEGAVQKLPTNSAVVMDVAPHHCRRTDKLPDFWWPRADVEEWLRAKGIEYKEEEFKVELLARVDKVQNEYRVFAADEIAKKHNVEVLRLPPFHIELNPIEEIWGEVRGIVGRNAYSTLEELKKLVQYAVGNMPVEKWQQSVERVKTEMEDYYYRLDDVIDEVSDEFLDNTEGFDTESEESETDSDEY